LPEQALGLGRVDIAFVKTTPHPDRICLDITDLQSQHLTCPHSFAISEPSDELFAQIEY